MTSSPLDASADLTLALPFESASAQLARSQLAAWLRGEVPLGVLEDCRLVVSELVGNAVRHAKPLGDGTMSVLVRRDCHRVDIGVRDGGGPTTPQEESAGKMALGGRGLTIVAALSDRWWVDDDGAGTTVFARVCWG